MNSREFLQKITQVFTPKRVKILGFSIIGFFTLFTVVWLLGRNAIVEWGLKKAQSKLANKGIEFKIKETSFDGIFGIRLGHVYLGANSNNGTLPPLFVADTFGFSVDFWNTLWHGPSIQNLKIAQGELNLFDSAGIQNFEFKSEDDEEVVKESNEKTNIIKAARKLLAQVPKNLLIRNFKIRVQDSAEIYKADIQSINFKGENLTANIEPYVITGELDRTDLTGNIEFNCTDPQGKIKLPGGYFGFGKAKFEIQDLIEGSNNEIEIVADGNVENLRLLHPRISDTTVQLSKIAGNVKVKYNSGLLELDSNSTFKLNALNFTAGGHYEWDQGKTYWVNFKIPTSQGKNLFSSLPAGLFQNTSGIKTTGSFGYRFFVFLDGNKLEKTRFESELTGDKDFKVIQWGMAQPAKLNGSFNHTYFRGDNAIRTFMVGPSNPNFTNFNEISPYVVRSVLRSEDPSFFYHKGFYTEAFRGALIHNYRAKRFARGGSTISMQLIKNVYLRQHKTLARKIEEIMLVWLIEREKAVSKNRMMEVYLNLIEWGPNVFGIGEASWFYFQKYPMQLSIGESVYLASLIPAPSKARWSIDSSGAASERWSRFTVLRNRFLAVDSLEFDRDDFKVQLHPMAVERLRGPQKRQIDVIPEEIEETN